MRWNGIHNYSIRTKTRIAVLLPVTVLLLSCSLLAWVSSEQQDANQWVVHTLQVRLTLSNLDSQLSAAEAALLTYFQSGTPAAQSAAQTSLVECQNTLSQVQELTSDNASQQRRISDANSILSDYKKLAGTPARSNQLLSAQSQLRQSLRRPLRSKIAEMDREEQRLLGSRTERTGKLYGVSSLVIGATLLLGCLGAFFGTSLLAGNISSRISRLLESSVLIAEGLQVKVLDSSRDEIGQLAAGLAQTSSVLSERASEIAEVNWKLQSVLNAATSVSIIAEDVAGRISLFNSGASRLLGYRQNEVMGRYLASIVQEEEGANRVGQGEAAEYETTYLRKDGIRLHVQVSITPLKNVAGKPLGRLHVAQDITPRKLLEMELRKKMDELKFGPKQPATADSEDTELPEWLRAEGSKDVAKLSSNLDALNNWYETGGHIPNPYHDEPDDIPRILIVDDFEPTRFLLRAYLQGEGYRLDFAANGVEALARVAERTYELILMDVEMPEMDGYEAASRIRSWEKSQGRLPVPIVALSAHSQTEADKTAPWTSYIQKPVSKAQLLGQVGSYLPAKL